MNKIAAISSTRTRAAALLAGELRNLIGRTEREVRDNIVSTFARESSVYASGWYDPPEGGVAALFDIAPFKRLQFETLRTPAAWPADTVFQSESVGIVYVSPVDKLSNMIGDIGLTIYTGRDVAIQDHIRTSLDMVHQVAEIAEVGMKFSDLYRRSTSLFTQRGGKVIGWITTNHDPSKVNLGHTVPGSDVNLEFGNKFAEIRETIRSKRIYLNEVERYEIPETCAFTLEARLTDVTLTSPNSFFHVIVSFDGGKKEIFANFDTIFESVGMTYML